MPILGDRVFLYSYEADTEEKAIVIKTTQDGKITGLLCLDDSFVILNNDGIPLDPVHESHYCRYTWRWPKPGELDACQTNYKQQRPNSLSGSERVAEQAGPQT